MVISSFSSCCCRLPTQQQPELPAAPVSLWTMGMAPSFHVTRRTATHCRTGHPCYPRCGGTCLQIPTGSPVPRGCAEQAWTQGFPGSSVSSSSTRCPQQRPSTERRAASSEQSSMLLSCQPAACTLPPSTSCLHGQDQHQGWMCAHRCSPPSAGAAICEAMRCNGLGNQPTTCFRRSISTWLASTDW